MVIVNGLNYVKNMEFKGTKGIWTADIEKGIVRKSDGNRLCLLYYTNYENKSEIPYNTILISKATEMLVEIEKDIEFLQNLCNKIEDVAVDDNLWNLESRLGVNEILARIEDKRQLIKQATEL